MMFIKGSHISYNNYASYRHVCLYIKIYFLIVFGGKRYISTTLSPLRSAKKKQPEAKSALLPAVLMG